MIFLYKLNNYIYYYKNKKFENTFTAYMLIIKMNVFTNF